MGDDSRPAYLTLLPALIGILVAALLATLICSPWTHAKGVALGATTARDFKWLTHTWLVIALLTLMPTAVFLVIYRITWKRVGPGLAAALLVLVAAVIAYQCVLSRPAREYYHCWNCGSFFPRKLTEYAEANNGYYPAGGVDEWDSLAKAIDEANDVHFFTCHALQPKAEQYWLKTGTLCEDVCCYRYVEMDKGTLFVSGHTC